jgi:glycerol-3-phosphate dehydrogenase
VGIGTALDAATRGLSVGLLEARDFASGTSGFSSKLVHGGIRYLEQLNFGLVREALAERGLLLQDIAPHLVTPIRFLYPVNHHVWERAYIGAGMMLYDGMSYLGGRLPGVPHHRHLSKRQVMMAAPGLAEHATVGGMTYYDGHVDDARYATTLARTAAHYGAHMATRTFVSDLLRDGDRVVGVRARDNMTGQMFEVRAKQVIVAAGVWTSTLQDMIGDPETFEVRMSKGVHILIEKEKFPSLMGLLLRTEKSVLFVIPWGRFWIIGTTDTAWTLDAAHPVATRADIDYILGHINKVLSAPLTHDDVVGVYAGLRPLLAGDSDETSKLSREHIVSSPAPGVTIVAGGKWTTYRVMAKDAVDVAVNDLPLALAARVPGSVTAKVSLLGAGGYPAAVNRRAEWARRTGLGPYQITRLLGRYGSEIEAIVELIEAHPALATTLPGTKDYREAEVVFAARYEMALHLDDVLMRRTRLVFESRDRAIQAADRTATLMAAELGWDAARTTREIADYTARATAELAAEQTENDTEAEAAWHRVADAAVGKDGFA